MFYETYHEVHKKTRYFRFVAVPLPLNRFSKNLYEIEFARIEEKNETIRDRLRPSVQKWRPTEVKIPSHFFKICKPHSQYPNFKRPPSENERSTDCGKCFWEASCKIWKQNSKNCIVQGRKTSILMQKWYKKWHFRSGWDWWWTAQ